MDCHYHHPYHQVESILGNREGRESGLEITTVDTTEE